MSSTRESAERLADSLFPSGSRESFVVDVIDKALQVERERAVKIVESEVILAAQLLTERGDEGRDILNYTDFIKGQKTAAQDILAAIKEGEP